MSRRLTSQQPAARKGQARDLAQNPPAALRPPAPPTRGPSPEAAAEAGADDPPEGVGTGPLSLDEKVLRISALLRRPVDSAVASPRQAGYRARITLRPGPGGKLGYTQPGSHLPAPIEADRFARPELAELAARLPPLPGFASVELRTDGERIVICAHSTARHGQQRGRRGADDRGTLARRLGEAIDGLGPAGAQLGASIDGRTVRGDPVLHPQVQGQRLRVGPNSFFQVNLEINELLVGAVQARLLAEAPSRVLDLYAGVGNLTLGLGRAGLGLTLIESAPGAVGDATKTAEAWGLPADRCEIRRADAHRFACGDAFFDVAVLDPPRIGAASVLSQLALTRPRLILYVSCNPHALAKDLEQARASGYEISELVVFDMFPGTEHAEVLCALRPR